MADAILAEIRASKKPFYVYILSKPDGTPFYVGMGRKDRIQKHEWAAKNTTKKSHKLNVIRKIWASGGQICKRFDSWHDTTESALIREAGLILEIGRSDIGTGPLTNHSSGGQYPLFGPEWRQKTADAIRVAMKDPQLRERLSCLAKKRMSDPAYKQRIRSSLKQWFIDNPELAEEYKALRAKRLRTQACRKKAAALTKEQFRDPARRKKQSQALKNYYINNPDALVAMSSRVSEYCAKPEVRAHMSEARKKFNAENPILAIANKRACAEGSRRPEVRAAASEKAKQRMLDNPEHQQRMVEAALTPTAKAKHALAQKTRFQNPAERMKAAGAAKAWMVKRNEVKARCLALLDKYGLNPPSGQASQKDWEAYESKLRGLLNDYST